MYKSEEVPFSTIHFEDNHECVDLIEKKPVGVMCLLDEECSLGKGTDTSFGEKIKSTFSNAKSSTFSKFYTHFPTKPGQFGVKHFAGEVVYHVDNFLEKNRDVISSSLTSTCQAWRCARKRRRRCARRRAARCSCRA